MDIVVLSRLQFALTVAFHFLFVPLSIGMIMLMSIFEYKHLKTEDDRYRKLTDYFGNIFIVNYAVGIVTGVSMSLQFGTNWGNYARFMGDVFGGPLAFEALLAFFLESTFTGVFIFKKHKMSPRFRFVTVFLIALGTSISALWIITASGFMHNPVGYTLSAAGDKAILTDFFALLTNPYAWYMLVHNLTAAYLLGAVMVLSISAAKLRDPATPLEDREVFALGTGIASKALLAFSLLMPVIGYNYMTYITPIQPAKIKMIQGEIANLGVSGGLQSLVNISFLIMVTLGVLFILLALYTIIFYKRYLSSQTLQGVSKHLWWTPFLAINVGWIVTEVGRQPWVVYGLMKTADGVSTGVPLSQVIFSIVTILLINVGLVLIAVILTLAQIKKGLGHDKYKYILEHQEGGA